MKEVYANPDSARVGLFKSLLEEAGIGCFVRNEASSNMMAGVPVPVFYPALCVVDDADYDQARVILNDYQAPAVSSGSEWICPHCKSAVPAEFGTCWSCERPRPAS